MPAIVKPVRPGTVIRFVGESIPRVLASFADVVAVPIVHDWGPINTPTLVGSILEFDAIFGNSDTAGRRAVILALNGQGGALGGGAGGVLVVRMAAPAAVESSVSITNTAAAAAITIKGKYPGVRGTRVAYSVAADPADATHDLLKLYFDGAPQERYSYVKTDINDLGAQINARSKLGKVNTAITSGTALTATNPADLDGTPLTGGNDGSTLTATEWTAAQTALDFARFSVFAPYNLTDSTIQAQLKSWIQGMADNNRPVLGFFGGPSNDTITTALARSVALADPHIVNLGVGSYHDALLDRDLSTAELAPRLAGAFVARGQTKSLTFAPIAGLTVVANSGPTSGDTEAAILGGVTVLSRAVSANADLHVEMGLTTFTSHSDAARPYDVFSDPRLVRIMDLYVRGMKEWGDENIVGGVVNQDSRDAVKAEARNRQDVLEGAGLLVPGSSFVTVDDPHDPALADAIPYDFGWQFARTANYVFGNGRIK